MHDSKALETDASLSKKYEQFELLGDGQTTAVYRALHRDMKRTIAIKILLPHACDAVNMLGLQVETKALSMCNHPNVLTAFDFGITSGGLPYIVMDYIAGQRLDRIIATEGALEPSRVREIFCQVCDGMSNVHAAGIIHRNLKPANIMVCRQKDGFELIKIIDFSLAKVPTTSNLRVPLANSTVNLIGTPEYRSPEQCRCEPADERSDIYSVGCSMYEALTGVTPFPGESLLVTTGRQMSEEPKPLSEISEKLAPWRAVVGKCLEKNADDRFQTMAELVDAMPVQAQQPKVSEKLKDAWAKVWPLKG